MKKKNFLPAWLYIWLTALYCELMIYIWNAESSTIGRFLTVLFFAIGEGALLAFVVSLLKPKAAKITAVVLAAVMAVAVISLIITVAALMMFVLDIPNWVKYLLLFCLVTQWHVPWVLVKYHSSFDTLLELMAGGVAYFCWPVLGVFLGRNIRRLCSWFSPFCWLVSILLLFCCFVPVFR